MAWCYVRLCGSVIAQPFCRLQGWRLRKPKLVANERTLDRQRYTSETGPPLGLTSKALQASSWFS